jgi:class 3 adenylate cyclase
VRGNCTVAVCDILGFSKLAENQPLATVVDNAIGWFRKALNHSLLKSGFPAEVPKLTELEAHPHVSVAWFSDTILFYTKSDTDEAVRQLLSTVAWLLFETILEAVTKVRGGIAYGGVHIDPENSLYVGTPIIEAYRLEQSQQWCGAALAQSAVNRLPEQVRAGEFFDWWIKPWDVPLKGNTSVRTVAVNWNAGIHHPTWRLRWSEHSDDPTSEDWLAKPDLCEKFANTKRFHLAHCRDCSSAAHPSLRADRSITGA